MIPKLHLSLAVALLTAWSPMARAQGPDGGPYVELFGGASALASTDLSFSALVTDTGFGTGTTAGGAVGYAFAAAPVRAELEFAYRTGDADDVAGDFASTVLSLNGYYDFGPADARFRPYLGAGVGYVTEIDYDVEGGAFAGEYSDRGGALGQVMVGARYALTPRVSLTGELRYFDAGSRTLDGPGGAKLDADYSGTDLTLGLAYQF